MPEKYVKVRLFVEPAPRGIDREVHAISIRALDTEDAPAQPEATLTDGSASAPVVGSDRDGGET
jgi:hypothetical protein